MKQITTIAELRACRQAMDKPIALVPTMGALHAGHLALVESARQLTDEVWVSIFVNPTQFGPDEDLSRYPRPIEADLEACAQADVSTVFMPPPEEIYPPGLLASWVDVPSLTAELEGAHRPGHFAGVCRVVLKLLNLCQPRFACFGQKDYQQLRVIEAMVADLNLPVSIQRVATMREPDGLAMSSRNVYLEPDQRRRARGVFKSLELATQLVQDDGELDPLAIESAMAKVLQVHGIEPDYATVRDLHSLTRLDTIDRPVVALVAGRLGPVRLIDNALIWVNPA